MLYRYTPGRQLVLNSFIIKCEPSYCAGVLVIIDFVKGDINLWRDLEEGDKYEAFVSELQLLSPVEELLLRLELDQGDDRR